jgi:cytochrome b involved in lipid metabolism
MRGFLSLLVAISLAGCTTQTPEVSEMPSSQVQQAPEVLENGEIAETEVEAMPQESQEAAQPEQAESTEEAQTPIAKPSAKPTPSASETEAPEREESPQPTPTPTRSPEREESPQPTPTPTRSPEPSPTPTKTQSGYTLADVAKNNSQASCWVAIEGMVYDLTNWIRSHPGGRAAILSLCGTDGTSSFRGVHGGQARPTATLSGYLLGPLTN